MLLSAVVLNEIVKNIFIKNTNDYQFDLFFIFTINTLAVAAYSIKTKCSVSHG